ncbi:hypothetical protein TOPH_00121 [Tolypocladium ophioglossoides CBS 100239]|uniref:Uncharacterized protein n=1 Tax=Tolypocladium ophioglossoides (strain CBS 100239) TaxID=1163406 RepID=A0A0L0NKV2_TOLOC|nr:hypothetical protein TOPH_00121 [Tolypocladium ophioglossoides CBS 100239]
MLSSVSAGCPSAPPSSPSSLSSPSSPPSPSSASLSGCSPSSMSTSSRGSSSAAWSDGVGASCASRRRVASLDKEDLAFGLSGTGVPRDGVNAPLEETGRGVSPSLSVTLGWLSPSARGVAWSLGAFLGVWPSLSPSASSSPPSFIPSRLSTSSFSSRISRRSIMPSSMILLNWSRRSFQVSL